MSSFGQWQCKCGNWNSPLIKDACWKCNEPKPAPVALEPVGQWGRHPEFLAKVGTFSGCLVLIKRARKFTVGQRVEYCDTSDLRGMSKGCTPTWQSGMVWKIDAGRLFISKV